MKKKIRVCVLKGGISGERKISLETGKEVEEALKKAGYEVFSLDPARRDFLLRLKKEKIDVVFVALHGVGGEDGTIQGMLELIDLPYVGSGAEASALAMNKVYSKTLFFSHDLPSPAFWVSYLGKERIPDFPPPWIVKPAGGGSTLGVTLVEKKEDLQKAIKKALQFDDQVIIEEYIRGRELTVGIIEDPEPKPLPIIEIKPKRKLYDYMAKYTDGRCEFLVPAPLEKEERERVKEVALKAFKVLKCRDLARVDLIFKEGIPYLLEVNTIPGLTRHSLVPMACQEAGISFPELIDKLIKRGLKRGRRN